MLGPALVAGSWQIGTIASYAENHWLILTQPLGFIVALVGLMGKLEMPPFDAPEAHTEIVAGALTEYSGRGLAIFNLGRAVELVVGLDSGIRFLSRRRIQSTMVYRQNFCSPIHHGGSASTVNPLAH